MGTNKQLPKADRFTRQEDEVIMRIMKGHTGVKAEAAILVVNELEKMDNPLGRNKSQIQKRYTYLNWKANKEKAKKKGKKAQKGSTDLVLVSTSKQKAVNLSVNPLLNHVPGKKVSIALEVAAVAVLELNREEKLLLARAIMKSEQHA